MTKTYDINIKEFNALISPSKIKEELVLTKDIIDVVTKGRRDIENILQKNDKRFLIIAGPCSIHDTKAACEYAQKIQKIRNKIKDKINLVMRVYFEKPRTTIGWKGLINDPFLDGSYNINEGLKKARSLLIEISNMKVPIANEILDPITPQYIAGLLSWVAIGARTIESQTHREMASGLSMPIGFKNSTDGSLDTAVNAMIAARAPQHFLGIDPQGCASVVKTTGNPFGHIVLRGGIRPNYDPVSIDKVQKLLKEKKLMESIMVDCSHDNSGQKQKGQPFVFKSVIAQRIEGNTNIIGTMLESNLFEGRQVCENGFQNLEYGVSITDECLSWETTEKLIYYAYENL